MAGTLKAKDPLTGTWINIAGTGPIGPVGPPGDPFIVVASFGVTRVPADLPVDGAFPIDWDEPGTAAYQMLPGNALYYAPTDPTAADAGHLYEFVGAQTPSGWIDVGKIQGPQGPTGVSTIIVGSFGSVATPAMLPPDGLIPIDWDGPGNPAAPWQMATGDSLYYDKSADPLDGHLFQYVGTGIDPAGWIDVGLIQGPPGADGPQGPIGPPGDDVHVGTDDPTSTKPTAELWYDTDDDRLLGPYDLPADGATYDVLAKTTDLDGDVGWRNVYSVPAGKVIQFVNEEGVKLNLYSTSFGLGITASTLNIFSNTNIKFNQNSPTGTEWANIHAAGMTLNSGHFYLPNDGHGIRFSGNGYIYKKVGAGVHIRKSVNNPMVKIENNDGGGTQDIVVVSGNQSLSHLNLVLSSHCVINGSNGSNSSHYYVNSATNDASYYFNVLEARRADNKTVFVMKGYQGPIASGQTQPDCHAKMYVNLGAEGIDEVTQWADYGDGQVCILCHGPMSATHFQDRNRSEMVAGTMAPIDPEITSRLIDAVRPVMFARNFRSPKATDANPEGFVRPKHDPIPTVGFDFDGVNGDCADLTGRITDSGGYSLGGMLAIAVAEIKSLRERVAQLEGGAA